jgi:hypothetical protein
MLLDRGFYTVRQKFRTENRKGFTLDMSTSVATIQTLSVNIILGTFASQTPPRGNFDVAGLWVDRLYLDQSSLYIRLSQ